jgi:hypothetical protein
MADGDDTGAAGAGAGDSGGAGAAGGAAGGAGSGGTAGGAANGKDQAAGAAAGAGKGAGSEKGAAGDGAGKGAAAGDGEIKVPDKFLVDGKPDYQKVLKSYTELERQQFRRREEVAAEVKTQLEADRVAALPATPGDYKIDGEFKIGEQAIQLKADDPMLNWLKETAHHYGVPQDDVNKIIQGYVGQMIAAQPAWVDEAKLLGANADARHARVDGWLRGNLSAENYNTMARMPATANLIKAVEELMVVAGSPPIADNAADLPGETYTRAELAQMMRDPKYSGVGGRIDPAFVAKVRAGFQRLSKQN